MDTSTIEFVWIVGIATVGYLVLIILTVFSAVFGNRKVVGMQIDNSKVLHQSENTIEKSEMKLVEFIDSTEKMYEKNLTQYDKFKDTGIVGFTDEELLEFLLSFQPIKSRASFNAKKLIELYPSLREAIDAVVSGSYVLETDFVEDPLVLKLIKDVSDRYLYQKLAELPIGNSAPVLFDFLYSTMRGLDREVMKAIFLDTENRIITTTELSDGTVDTATIFTREIVKHSLIKRASSVIFAHNHINGNPQPSESDVDITNDLSRACHLFEINVLDHLVIGDNCYYSFAEKGMI